MLHKMRLVLRRCGLVLMAVNKKCSEKHEQSC